MSEAYNAIEQAAGPFVKHYREDLTKHDREEIAGLSPRCPFLHVARECGTHLIPLIPASEYPAKGAAVPYLFGTREREGLLKSGEEWLRAIEKQNPGAAVHYWDGYKLARINYAKAYEIEERYRWAVRQVWREWERPATAAELDAEERRYMPTTFYSFA